MLFKHIVVCFLLNLSFNVCGLRSRTIFTPANGQQLLENIVSLTDTLIEVTAYINLSLAEVPPNCVQMLCKLVCFNGVSTNIEMDILMITQKNNYSCAQLEELRLYNYVFPDGKLSYGFLGNYSNKVEMLYLACANITDVEAGAFSRGIFREIYFENLQLRELRRDFFKGISHDFNTLSIIQKQMAIQTVYTDFLCDVKYLIKSLTLQAGLKSVSNLTGGDFLLNKLLHTDFSHNDLGSRLQVNAFSKVSRLEWLDLSNSKLEYIPSYLFANLITTLEFLDLSHNKLITISRLMFGWREIPRDLKTYAEDNEWSCSCYLQREMIYINLQYRMPLICSEPNIYQGLSLFDDQLCDSDQKSFESTTDILNKSSEEEGHDISAINEEIDEVYIHKETTELLPNKTTISYSQLPDFMKLDCSTDLLHRHDITVHFLRWPLIVFNVVPRERIQVDVVVDTSEHPCDAYGLIWFSKVTSKYNQMAINYNEYGLGCYSNISVVTTVRDLTPNTAYTFCIVFKQQLTVSPFNCKSMYVENNMTPKTGAWLTRDMKITGYIVFIFGTVMSLFGGILIIYLLFKHKPALLTGSQKDENAILSEQKSMRPIKIQDEKPFSCGSFGISPRRRNSIDSEASYESYINANIYEVIPAHDKIITKPANALIKQPADQKTFAEINKSDADSYYLTPLESRPSAENCIYYAAIPQHHSKRNSNDVLPQLPQEVPSSHTNKSDYARIGNIYFLDSHV